MERIFKKNSKNKKSRRQPRKGVDLGQKSSLGYSQVSHTRDRYPEIPRQFQFSSQWTQTVEIDLAGTQYNRALGLFDLLANVPAYVPEIFRLYRYCRLSSVDVTLKVSGEADESNQNFSYEAAMARIPYDQSLNITPQELRHVRGSSYSLRSVSGMNCVTLRGHFGAFDELGNPVLDRQHWLTEAEAYNPTPPEPDRPVVSVGVRSVNGNRGFVSINLTARYHMQFFDLQFTRLRTVEQDEDSEFEAQLDGSHITGSHTLVPKKSQQLTTKISSAVLTQPKPVNQVVKK